MNIILTSLWFTYNTCLSYLKDQCKDQVRTVSGKSQGQNKSSPETVFTLAQLTLWRQDHAHLEVWIVECWSCSENSTRFQDFLDVTSLLPRGGGGGGVDIAVTRQLSSCQAVILLPATPSSRLHSPSSTCPPSRLKSENRSSGYIVKINQDCMRVANGV